MWTYEAGLHRVFRLDEFGEFNNFSIHLVEDDECARTFGDPGIAPSSSGFAGVFGELVYFSGSRSSGRPGRFRGKRNR